MILGASTITLIQHAPDIDNADGTTTLGAETQTVIRGSIQPLRGKELEILSEGDRQEEFLKIYVATPRTANPADQYTITTSDLIEIDGVRFQVIQPHRYRSLLAHDKIYVKRLQE